MSIVDLNLLPPNRQALLRYESIQQILRHHLVGLGIFLALVIFVLVGSHYLLQQRLRQEEEHVRLIQQQTIQEQGELLDERIREFNKHLERVKTLQSTYTKWSPVLLDLFERLPAGITMQTLDLDKKTKVVKLHGIADRREDLLALQEAFADSPNFKNPSTPVSNLLQRENITFDVSFSLLLPS